MPSNDPTRGGTNVAPNPNVFIKKVSWLELFFDVMFALALSMAAHPLANLNEFSSHAFLSFGQFFLVFLFLIIFWYRHMALINRYDNDSFLLTVITLFVAFLVVAFTQFLNIWAIDPLKGSFLSIIAIFLAVMSLAGLYFISSLHITQGDVNVKKWARASAKHFTKEAGFYLIGIVFVDSTPWIIPFWFIGVFFFFNRYPFAQWMNPKAPINLPPELQNVPAERMHHKTERIGLFSLMVYGLLIVLAAAPLISINSALGVAGILDPVINFGKVFFMITIVWYIHYRLFEIAQPKGHQFTAITFIALGLLVAATQFIRMMALNPSGFITSAFSITIGALFTSLAIAYWNIKTMLGQGIMLNHKQESAFAFWSYTLYTSAAIFFIAPIFMALGYTELIWSATFGLLFLGLFIERRLTVKYYMGQKEKPNAPKYLDIPTRNGLMFIILGGIIFFVVVTLLDKPITSLWILTWIIPLFLGIFMILNQWLNKRIKPN